MSNKNICLTAQCANINQGSISNAIITCINNPGYYVGIYVSTHNEISQVREAFILEWVRCSGDLSDYRYRTSSSSGIVWQFPNGSIIKILVAGEGVRGYRFNSALISTFVSPHLIRNVIYPSLRNYIAAGIRKTKTDDIVKDITVHEYNNRTQNSGFINEDMYGCEDNHELDEFINSFKINKNT